MKNGAELTESDNMMFYNESRVLTFLSLNKTDSGQYSCIISNPLSSGEAKYDMVVYFGPENVQIHGPSTLSVNESLTLTCSADSTPPPTFTWKLNETVIPFTSDVLKKHITDVSESGKYICEVMNSVTGRYSSAVHELTVTLSPGPTQKSRCSAGCIAGIVIGCLVLIALCGVLVFVLLRKKKVLKKTSKETQAPEQEVKARPMQPSQEIRR
ncbi:hypothetical protein INR49_032777 [Caranx melampygus]|nr:hypothetical protein INR49_032777 [Caranx melampygus]